jgi:hypothetical protein
VPGALVPLLREESDHVAPEVLRAGIGLHLEVEVLLEAHPVAGEMLQLRVVESQQASSIHTHESSAPSSAMRQGGNGPPSLDDAVRSSQVNL